MAFDVVIQGGTVIDGSGRPGTLADVALSGDRIAAVGQLEGVEARSVIAARGKIVCPGFVDVHVHSETALVGGTESDRYGGVLQGVTTHLMGPDGFGWAPLAAEQAQEMWQNTRFAHDHPGFRQDYPTVADYLNEFVGRTPANVAPQVPHCAVRLGAMGWDARPPTADEVATMVRATREWMEAGAVALALGLDYPPSAHADTDELVALCRVVHEYGGIYAAHVRYNDLGEAGAWRETMEIGRRAEIPVHINHAAVTDTTAPLLDEAAASADLTFDSYMYPAGCTHLALMLPVWAQAGGVEGVRARLRDSHTRAQLAAHLEVRLSEAQARGATPIFAATQTGRFIGRSLFDVAKELGGALGAGAVRILDEEDPYALMVFHHGTPEAQQQEITRRTARHSRLLVASDGVYHGPLPHPRGWGCFSRVFRLCVRELGAVTLEGAIHAMSGRPAARFGLTDRGQLQPGFGADVVIFDPQVVADRATFAAPREVPVGIDRVLVNGQTVVLDGQPTGVLPGRVVRRGEASRMV